MTIGDRIKKVRGKLSRDVFAELFGVSRNTIQRYETGEGKPDSAFIEAVCKKYEIHSDWLIMGRLPQKLGDSYSGVNQSILADAISALEEALQAKGRVMKPQAKAEIIAELYQFIKDDEQGKGAENIAKILKLVA